MKASTFYKAFLSAFVGSVLLTTGLNSAAAPATSKLKGQYVVMTTILQNGKVVSSPRFVILPTKSASLVLKSESPKSDLRVKLSASDFGSEKPQGEILLFMKLEYKTMEHEIRFESNLVVTPGEEGTFDLGGDTSTHFEMKVTAERQ